MARRRPSFLRKARQGACNFQMVLKKNKEQIWIILIIGDQAKSLQVLIVLVTILKD